MDTPFWKSIAISGLISFAFALFTWYCNFLSKNLKLFIIIAIIILFLLIFIVFLYIEIYKLKKEYASLITIKNDLEKNRDALSENLRVKTRMLDTYKLFVDCFYLQLNTSLQNDEKEKIKILYELFLLLKKELIKEDNVK